MKRKHTYREEDIVRIVNPLFVTRVGYPWDKEYVKNNVITEEQKKELEQFLIKFHISPREKTTLGSDYLIEMHYGEYSSAFKKILDEIAYGVLKNNHFGGDTRTIHTNTIEEYKGKLAVIRSKRTVKTGEYQRGSSTYDYWNGGTEYDPPQLLNQETHIILEVELFSDDGMWAFIRSKDYKPLEIEECNVELYEKIKRWKVSLHPNNQPSIELGIHSAKTSKEALRRVCLQTGLKENDDGLYIKEVIE